MSAGAGGDTQKGCWQHVVAEGDKSQAEREPAALLLRRADCSSLLPFTLVRPSPASALTFFARTLGKPSSRSDLAHLPPHGLLFAAASAVALGCRRSRSTQPAIPAPGEARPHRPGSSSFRRAVWLEIRAFYERPPCPAHSFADRAGSEAGRAVPAAVVLQSVPSPQLRPPTPWATDCSCSSNPSLTSNRNCSASATYSVTAPTEPSAHRTVHLGSNRCLARYASCPPGADLAYGFERCVWPDEARKADEGLDDLIASIARFEREKLGGLKVLGKGKEGASLGPCCHSKQSRRLT